MKDITKEMFCDLLLRNKSGYSLARAARIYNQLTDADEDIQFAALQWIEEDEQPSLSAEGWSVDQLEARFGMNALAALLTIDWLRKDPRAAIIAINEGIQ